MNLIIIIEGASTSENKYGWIFALNKMVLLCSINRTINLQKKEKKNRILALRRNGAERRVNFFCCRSV